MEYEFVKTSISNCEMELKNIKDKVQILENKDVPEEEVASEAMQLLVSIERCARCVNDILNTMIRMREDSNAHLQS